MNNERQSRAERWQNSPTTSQPSRHNKWSQLFWDEVDTINYYDDKAGHAIEGLVDTINMYGDKTAHWFTDISQQPFPQKLATTGNLLFMTLGSESTSTRFSRNIEVFSVRHRVVLLIFINCNKLLE